MAKSLCILLVSNRLPRGSGLEQGSVAGFLEPIILVTRLLHVNQMTTIRLFGYLVDDLV